MFASIDFHLAEDCSRCGGDGKEKEIRLGIGKVVWLGPCPDCVSGKVPTQLGYDILNFLHDFRGHPEFDIPPVRAARHEE